MLKESLPYHTKRPLLYHAKRDITDYDIILKGSSLYCAQCVITVMMLKASSLAHAKRIML